MTTLGREVVEAASIVAVTTAFLAAGRGEERATFLPHRHDRTSSRLGLAAGLTAVALLAALAVVVVFWPQGGASDAPPAPEPAATTSGGSARSLACCRSPLMRTHLWRIPRSDPAPHRLGARSRPASSA